MLSGFKKFILRGNVVDMAVGVVIGAAFGGVVTALTNCSNRGQARFLGRPVHGPRLSLSDRAFHQRRDLVPADLRGYLFLRGDSRERPGRTHAQRPGPRRSHHKEMSRMLERDSHRCSPLRPLCAAGDRQGRLTKPVMSAKELRRSTNQEQPLTQHRRRDRK